MDFAVIIPVKNSRERLSALLTSLRANSSEVPHEVIVVDDGSEEDLAPLCKEHGVVHHRLPQNHGPAFARNEGARLANTPVLFFLDADIVYPAGLFERAKAELEADPEVQAVSFLNQSYEQSDNVVQNFSAVLERHWFGPFIPPGERRGACWGISTRHCAIRREAFEAVGGFDAHFATNALEDYDLGKRLGARFKLIVVDEPVVYHHFPFSLWRLVRNNFVRAALFVPYFKKHKPGLNRQQVSRREGFLRLLGTFSVACALVGVSPVPLRGVFLAMGLAALLAYVAGIASFLKDAYRWSHRLGFVVACVPIHLATSVAITVGAAWGALHVCCSAIPLPGSRKEPGSE